MVQVIMIEKPIVPVRLIYRRLLEELENQHHAKPLAAEALATITQDRFAGPESFWHD